MKAFVKLDAEPGSATVQDVSVPELDLGEVLVRVAACGVCGSDLHALRSDPGYEWLVTPLVLGHEFSGTVELTGSRTSSFSPGDHVVGIAIQGCGSCTECHDGKTNLCFSRKVAGLSHDGGMAEYVSVPEEHLIHVPKALDLKAAALAEPLSVAVHAVMERSAIRPGDAVVVSGPGPIGLLCASVAKLCGGEVLVTGAGADSDLRLPAAERLGLLTGSLDERPLEEHLCRSFERRGVDAWIEASGATSALTGALDNVHRGGSITVVGMFSEPISLLPNQAVRNELRLNFSYASTRADYRVALDLLARGEIDPAILSQSFPIEQSQAAFDASAAGRAIKPLLTP